MRNHTWAGLVDDGLDLGTTSSSRLIVDTPANLATPIAPLAGRGRGGVEGLEPAYAAPATATAATAQARPNPQTVAMPTEAGAPVRRRSTSYSRPATTPPASPPT